MIWARGGQFYGSRTAPDQEEHNQSRSNRPLKRPLAIHSSAPFYAALTAQRSAFAVAERVSCRQAGVNASSGAIQGAGGQRAAGEYAVQYLLGVLVLPGCKEALARSKVHRAIGRVKLDVALLIIFVMDCFRWPICLSS